MAGYVMDTLFSLIQLNDEDDEPEWMSFGPTDKYELMELKGLEEHELGTKTCP